MLGRTIFIRQVSDIIQKVLKSEIEKRQLKKIIDNEIDFDNYNILKNQRNGMRILAKAIRNELQKDQRGRD
jgi:hypothetical protein